jgi:sulfate adenylyltransferase subunit 1 (EFTu-like GTPase family)
MDLVGHEEDVFEAIREEFEEFSSRLEIHDIVFIPISALWGDNVVDASSNMPWYRGKSLLSHLEDVHIASDGNLIDFRFPVQCVLSAPGYRAAGGQVASGVIRVGDEVVVLPAGVHSRVASLELGGRSFEEAFVPMGINVILEDPIEVTRGDLMARPGNHPVPTQDLEAMICWLNKEPLLTGGEYSVQHTTRHVPSVLEKVVYRIDPETLHRHLDDKAVQMNDIARVHIRSSAPLMVDSYWRNRATGSFILVDPSTGATVAAGMVL